MASTNIDVRATAAKHPLPSPDTSATASKKLRTSACGKPGPATPSPAAAAAAPWMIPPTGAPGTGGAPAMMMPSPMGMAPPFFMPPPMAAMMPPQMMAMQAYMMMQMQMQTMQAMMQQQQQQQQQGSMDSNPSATKPSAAAAAAASLGFSEPLPCYPAMPFMRMCFPPPVPAMMQQQQAHASAQASTQQQQQLPTGVQPQLQQPAASSPTPLPGSTCVPQPCPAPQVVDVAATNLSDKDFAAFIDSFVSDDPFPQALSKQLPGSCQDLVKLGGSNRSSSGSESTDDDFCFSLDDLLPLDAVTSQVESALAYQDEFCSPSNSPCSAPAAGSALLPLPGSNPQLLLEEDGGEESDLIFGVSSPLDGLLHHC